MNVVERAPAQGTSLPAEPAPAVAEAPAPAADGGRARAQAPAAARAHPLCRDATADGRSPRSPRSLVAALATLAVPLAVRRMIDFGFTHQGMNLIDSYFAVMIAVAGVLAVASAARYYLVITLGERIVADLRSDVFNHLTVAVGLVFRSGQDRRDALAAHRRHHPDQVRGRLVGVGRAAQHRAVRRRDHHDGDHQPAAVAVRADRHSGDRAAALRLRARDPAARPRGAGYARRRLGLCRRTDRRRAHAAGLHQREAWRAAASRRRSSAPSRPRKARPARARC